jgi:hypothetical protein
MDIKDTRNRQKKRALEKTIQPVQPVQPVQPNQPVQLVQPVQPVQPVQKVKPKITIEKFGYDDREGFTSEQKIINLSDKTVRKTQEEKEKEPLSIFKLYAGDLSYYGLTRRSNLKNLLSHYYARYKAGYTQKVNIIFKSTDEEPKILFIGKVSNREAGNDYIIKLCRDDKTAINFSELKPEDSQPKIKTDKTDYNRNYYLKLKEDRKEKKKKALETPPSSPTTNQ